MTRQKISSVCDVASERYHISKKTDLWCGSLRLAPINIMQLVTHKALILSKDMYLNLSFIISHILCPTNWLSVGTNVLSVNKNIIIMLLLMA